MNKSSQALLVSIALGAAFALLALSAAVATPSDTAPPPSAVVLELFTSQGCSTCPPADQLLSRLASEPQWQGHLVPLALHVDYWNQVGWTDPFSSATWSDRQRAYAKALDLDEVYTPQAVVNGRSICIGSNEAELRRLLAEAAARPAGRVELHLQRTDSKVAVEIVASPPAGHTGDLDVMLAVVESGLETQVKYGENAHRTLHDDFAVRRLTRVAKLKGAELKDTATLRLERGWKAEATRVAVFLQDPATREIFGGASVAIPPLQ